MDEKVVAKEPLTVSAVMKKVLAPSFRVKVLRLSLLAALVLACTQGGFLAYELSGKQPCSTFLPCYKLKKAAMGVVGHLKLGIALCIVPQGVSAALALMFKKGRRALAFIALLTFTATNCMYGGMMRFIDAPAVDLPLALDIASLIAFQVLDLLGCLALLLGAGRE